MTQLGEELRRERTRRGLTFKEVEQRLHIRSTYLEALEDGQYDLIPGEVYTKGFIRNYGNFLGLNGARLVADYKRTRGSEEDLETLQVVNDGRLIQAQDGSRPSLEELEGQRRLGSSRNRWLALVIAVILILFLLWIIH